ncbi:MAG: transcription elongation factor GreA [Candidatus Paceibacterota bacterium]
MDIAKNAEEGKIYLSQEKQNELTKELKTLKTEKRKEIADKLEYTKSLGDLSENAEYQEARDAQAGIEERIATIEAVLKNAVVVLDHKIDSVSIGSVVTLKKEGESSTKTYEIVGAEESNIVEGKISNRCPLGEALMGKKKGEEALCRSPKGDISYSVIKIA